jgi:TatD DNase family protein
MILVDSHCHLNYALDKGEDIAELIKRSDENHVKYMQTIGTTRDDFKIIQPLAEKYENVFCSYGIHPHNAGEGGLITADEIREGCALNKVIGIGETGLDYFYDNAPREDQWKSFVTHLEVARELDMPVIIHTRDAEEDTMSILKEAMQEGQSKILLHCFSSKLPLAEFAVEHGLYMSASGIITFGANAEEVRQGFMLCPMDKLLVETDAPYLAPKPYRGKTNEPAYTLHTAEKLADMKSVSLEEMAKATTDNFFMLFNKAASYRKEST